MFWDWANILLSIENLRTCILNLMDVHGWKWRNCKHRRECSLIVAYLNSFFLHVWASRNLHNCYSGNLHIIPKCALRQVQSIPCIICRALGSYHTTWQKAVIQYWTGEFCLWIDSSLREKEGIGTGWQEQMCMGRREGGGGDGKLYILGIH